MSSAQSGGRLAPAGQEAPPPAGLGRGPGRTSPAPTVEYAYQLARSGQFRDIASLKVRLKADGCRAVDALLSARSIKAHLTAICAATFKPAE